MGWTCYYIFISRGRHSICTSSSNINNQWREAWEFMPFDCSAAGKAWLLYSHYVEGEEHNRNNILTSSRQTHTKRSRHKSSDEHSGLMLKKIWSYPQLRPDLTSRQRGRTQHMTPQWWWSFQNKSIFIFKMTKNSKNKLSLKVTKGTRKKGEKQTHIKVGVGKVLPLTSPDYHKTLGKRRKKNHWNGKMELPASGIQAKLKITNWHNKLHGC